MDAFSRRSNSYDDGRLGRFHRDLALRVVELAASCAPHSRRILDLGCGTGYALSLLEDGYPDSRVLVGVDPADGMIRVARDRDRNGRTQFTRAMAERLPFHDTTFDLVLATTTFDHWSDQAAGLAECSRVLADGGLLVLSDLFGLALAPTLVARPGKARTRRRAERLLGSVGLQVEAWRRTYPPVVQTVLARRDDRGECPLEDR